MSNLSPCPFCGNDGSDPSSPLDVQSGSVANYVHCQRCGAFGPDGENDGDPGAVEVWNQRPQQLPAAALRAAVQDLMLYADVSVDRTARVVLVDDILAAIAELEGNK